MTKDKKIRVIRIRVKIERAFHIRVKTVKPRVFNQKPKFGRYNGPNSNFRRLLKTRLEFVNYELEQKNPESSRTEIESRTELVTQMYKICHGAKIYKKRPF